MSPLVRVGTWVARGRGWKNAIHTVVYSVQVQAGSMGQVEPDRKVQIPPGSKVTLAARPAAQALQAANFSWFQKACLDGVVARKQNFPIF